MDYCFVPECNHAHESHTCQWLHFFCHIWKTMACRDPEILRPWQCDKTSPLFHKSHQQTYDEFSSSAAAAGLSKVLILQNYSNVQTKITSHNCLF